jgi:hypothetical protein
MVARKTKTRVVEDNRERFENEKLQAMVDTLSGPLAQPGAAYFAPPSIPFEPTKLTNPKLIMAHGDRRRKKRRMYGLETDADKGQAVSNVLHRTGLRPRQASETPYYKVVVPEDEQIPRGQTPSLGPWPSDDEGGSDYDGLFSEDESDGSDKDYQG